MSEEYLLFGGIAKGGAFGTLPNATADGLVDTVTCSVRGEIVTTIDEAGMKKLRTRLLREQLRLQHKFGPLPS